MMQQWFLVMMTLLVLFSAVACAPAEEPPLPTLAGQQESLPLEETPIEEPAASTEADPTNTPRPSGRPTLPPTWTPQPSPTMTNTPEPVFPSPTPFIPAAGVPDACSNFVADIAGSTIEFRLGTPPTAAWTSIEGAELYRLTLAEANGRVIRDDIYLTDTQYQFDGSLFEEGRFYGWSVYPINANGDQMCFQAGLELIPFVPIGE